MPLCADTNATTDIFLPTDEHLPADTRPAFVSRFLSYSDSRKVEQLVEQAVDENDDAKSFELLWQALTLGIVGWRNFKGPGGLPLVFNPANLREAMSDASIWWLARNYPLKLSTSEHERFLSSSQPRVVQAPSAAAALPDAPSMPASTSKPTSPTDKSLPAVPAT